MVLSCTVAKGNAVTALIRRKRGARVRIHVYTACVYCGTAPSIVRLICADKQARRAFKICSAAAGPYGLMRQRCRNQRRFIPSNDLRTKQDKGRTTRRNDMAKGCTGGNAQKHLCISKPASVYNKKTSNYHTGQNAAVLHSERGRILEQQHCVASKRFRACYDVPVLCIADMSVR